MTTRVPRFLKRRGRKAGKALTAETDTGPSHECLLFMSIDRADMSMFELLLGTPV
jgi:hypothetical protein